MMAALRSSQDFNRLDIVIVDNSKIADVVLEVGYTFAWDSAAAKMAPLLLKSWTLAQPPP